MDQCEHGLNRVMLKLRLDVIEMQMPCFYFAFISIFVGARLIRVRFELSKCHCAQIYITTK